MVTLDKEKNFINLVDENKKEFEDDKDCIIIEKIKKMPEILVINLEIDNINIDFEYHKKIPVDDSKEIYLYTLKGINKYNKFSFSCVRYLFIWYKFDDNKCCICNKKDILKKIILIYF